MTRLTGLEKTYGCFSLDRTQMERMPEMKKSLVLLGAALATLLLAGPSVYADSIPWGYSAAPTTIFNNNVPQPPGTGTSSILMAGSSGVASGNSGIIIYNVTATSTATDAAPDGFSSVPFNLAVTLTDIKGTASLSATAKPSDVVNFSGLFNASNVTTKSLFPGVNSWTSPVTATVKLGSDDTGWNFYKVTVFDPVLLPNSFTPPGQPGGAPGSIEAIVEINPPDGSGEIPPTATPEPTSLVLAGLGLPLVVLLRRRMKKGQPV
jgi:hypothetical protein